MLRCDNCRLLLDEIKIKHSNKHECLWTSHISMKILCSDCMIAEYESHGRELPNNSLKSLNNERTK